MPLKIVRNDITKMETEAIVNTANDHPTVGTGCDSAVYKAAGFDQLLAYRREKIGFVEEGEAFLTPGFNLKAKYIIHAVSPFYMNGEEGEEEKLRSCYRNALRIAEENEIKSIAFPLISTGGFGYPKEEGMRIAVDEINSFLLSNDMTIYIVVFDEKATKMGGNIYPGLKEYIDQHYVDEANSEEYEGFLSKSELLGRRLFEGKVESPIIKCESVSAVAGALSVDEDIDEMSSTFGAAPEFDEEDSKKLDERLAHLSDSFSEYLMYLIQEKGLKNADVWKDALVDKKVFSKIKNDREYHPTKRTALCLCIGAKLNLDEAIDLLARAGYALSPCDKTDLIFAFFIERKYYDMIDLDIELEKHGLPCIIY